MHFADHAAERVHTRRALSRTLPALITNSHQEPVLRQACNPPDPEIFYSSFVKEFLCNPAN